jgi:hypothetical protein
LPLKTVFGSLYYFQNRKTNSAKKFPFLTRFAAQFTASQKYSAGEILSDNANAPTQIFVASSIKGTAPPGAGWIADPLVGGQPLHYVTGNDLLPVYYDYLRFNTGETDLNPTVTIKDRVGNIINPSFEKLDDNNASVVLADIHILPEDFFTIKIADAAKSYTNEFSFYHLLQNSNSNAVLDLSIKSDDAAYDMVNNTGFLLSPVYELRFRNRSLPWQYNGEKFTAKPTTPPNPLTKFGFIPVSLKNDANKDVDLPNPNIRMIKVNQPANDQQHYDLFTETFIN